MNRIKSFNNKNTYMIFIFVCLASLQFYQLNFIPVDVTVWKFIYYFSITIMTAAILIHKTTDITIYKNKCFTFIGAFILCQLISIYNVSQYKNQPLGISIVATLQYVGFLAYLLLCKSNITVRQCEKIISFFAWTFAVLTILNMMGGDALFGNYEFDADRGGMRYRLPGIGWVILFCFQNVNKYIEERKQRNMWIAVLMFIFTVLSLTRQVMAITFLLMVLMIIYKAKIYQKILVAIAILFATIFILPKVSIFNKMLNFTNDQMNANYDNIRIVAFNYYGFEYPKNTNEVLFGVGVPSFGKSQYGNEINWTEENLKVYTSDVGYIDIYFKFGIVALICIFLAQIVCIRRKTKLKYLYAKYYLVANMLLAIASTPYFSDTLSICLTLYILSLKSTLREPNGQIQKETTTI